MGMYVLDQNYGFEKVKTHCVLLYAINIVSVEKISFLHDKLKEIFVSCHTFRYYFLNDRTITHALMAVCSFEIE